MNIKPIFKVSLKSMLRTSLIYFIVIVCVFISALVVDNIWASSMYDPTVIDAINELDAGEKAYLGENDEIIIEYSDGSKEIIFSDGSMEYHTPTGDIIYHESVNIISGLETSAGIFLFICGIIFYKEMLWLGFANGISRKTVYISNVLVGIVTSVILALGLFLICNFFGNFGVITDYVSTFDQIYLDEWGIGYKFSSGASKFMLNILFDIFAIFDAYIIGMLIGGVFYRANKIARIAIAVGVPVTFTLIVPSVLDYAYTYSVKFAEFLDKVGDTIYGIAINPVYTVVTFFTLAVVMFFVTFFTYRKAPLKTND